MICGINGNSKHRLFTIKFKIIQINLISKESFINNNLVGEFLYIPTQNRD